MSLQRAVIAPQHLSGCHVSSAVGTRSTIGFEQITVGLPLREDNYVSIEGYSDDSIYRVRQKSRPLKFFAVFSATIWDFNMKFYRFI